MVSRIDPIARSEAVVRGLRSRPLTLYFCPSPLYGYGLSALLAAIGPDSAVIGVEAEAALFAFTASDLSAVMKDEPRFAYIQTDDPAVLCAFVRRRFGARRFRRVMELRLTSGWAAAESAYRAMLTAISDEIGLEWSNAMTLVRLGRRYALNAVRNLPALALAPTLCPGAFGAAPVIALAAGPSLNACADALAMAADRRGRYRLLCVDTAFPALATRGLRPDLVIALESQFWNLRDFIGMDPTVPRLCDLSAYPATTETAGTSFFHVRWTQLCFLDRLANERLLPPERPALGSVGISLVDLALYLSSGPIGLAGLDFGFTMDAYHAKGTPSGIDRFNRSDRLISLIDPRSAFREGSRMETDKNGKPLCTDPALRRYRELFRREFGGHESLFDLGESGTELGIQRLCIDDFLRMAAGVEAGTARTTAMDAAVDADYARRLLTFIDAEIALLSALRSNLSGEAPEAMDRIELDKLADELDYLWAHFPECAGADGPAKGRRPPLADPSFAKRVRVEIDPFLKAFGLARAELIHRCF